MKPKDRKKGGGCYHCGSQHHRAKECPNVVCRICHEMGHDVGGCLQKSLPPVDLGSFETSVSVSETAAAAAAAATVAVMFTYIELFCGMGGFRVALDQLRGKCVFASEIDRHCRANYFRNFGDVPAGDICRIPSQDIPFHDLLVAGFPCQPFSSSGNQKGLQDPRGTLFREIVRILQTKQPKAFLLENVRGLLLHKQGKTLQHVIVKELEDCGYSVQYQLVDAVHLLPQERCRLFLVGIRQDLQKESDAFEFPTFPNLERGVQDILHQKEDGQKINNPDALCLNPNQLNKVQSQKYTKTHPESRFLSDLSRPSKTIQSSYMKYMVGSQFVPVMGSDNDILEPKKWRRFSSREAARLQGFPEALILCPQRAHHMVGNAVAPPIIAMIAAPLIDYIGCRRQDDGSSLNQADWGWDVTKTLLLAAAPNDFRKNELKQKLVHTHFKKLVQHEY